MGGATDRQAIDELLSIEAIKKLKARYVDACDGGWGGRESHDVDRITGLFTEDCVWDGGAFGSRIGREALRQYYLSSDRTKLPAAFHVLSNPDIRVEGDHARGEWHLTILLSMHDQASVVVCGRFEDEYRRDAGVWLIHRSRFVTAIRRSYDNLWSFVEAD